ncbi:hypothetical protein L873DRAFT_1818369, partial [Choiromyces venosus 120613-1]
MFEGSTIVTHYKSAVIKGQCPCRYHTITRLELYQYMWSQRIVKTYTQGEDSSFGPDGPNPAEQILSYSLEESVSVYYTNS